METKEMKNIYDEAYKKSLAIRRYLKIDKTCKFKVIVLEDLRIINKIFKGEDQAKPVAQLIVEHEGEIKTWEFSEGGCNSIFGQIAYLGKEFGSLVGKVLNWRVTINGNHKNFQCDEYFDLVNNDQDK